MRNVEFYADTNGTVYMQMPDGSTKMLRESDRDIITDLLSTIADIYPRTYDMLIEHYSKHSRNKVYFEFRMAQRFIRCNWPKIDSSTMDVDANGKMNFEPFFCPIRDECPLSGIVCNPKIDSNLTEREKEVFTLIAECLQTSDISKRMMLSEHTINRHRENIKTKIGVHSVAEMIDWWHNNQPL